MTRDSERMVEEDSPKPVSRLERFKLAAGILLDRLRGPSEQQLQKILADEQRCKVIGKALDMNTGTRVETMGDGTKSITEPSDPIANPSSGANQPAADVYFLRKDFNTPVQLKTKGSPGPPTPQ